VPARKDQVQGAQVIDVELYSSWPVTDVRVPGFEAEAKVQPLGVGRHRVTLERQAAPLGRDFVLYYRLQDDLPGRVELIPYRAAADGPGTFMLVVTPGWTSSRSTAAPTGSSSSTRPAACRAGRSRPRREPWPGRWASSGPTTASAWSPSPRPRGS
jgi:hypothetical protein